MMLLPNALLLAALAAAPFQDTKKEAPEGPGAESVPIVHATDPEYNALLMRYEAAIQEYDDIRIRKNRRGGDEPDPAHPAVRFLAEFVDLARKDSSGAQGRVVLLLRTAKEDAAERVKLSREFVPQLAAKHADDDSVLMALDGLTANYADFEEEEILGWAQAFIEKSRVDEIKATALMLEAYVRSRGDTTTDPERLKDREEIYRSILYGFPKTRVGKQVSGGFYGPLHKRFFDAERAWVDEIQKLQASGKGAETWPPQPILEFPDLYRPLSLAGHHSASQFVNKLYPAYEQAARQSLGFGYQWLANEIGTYYSDGIDGPWSKLRADMTSVILRQYPNEKWTHSLLKRVAGSAEVLPAEKLEPALQVVLEKNTEPRVQSWATFCLAQLAKMRGDQAGYQRAMELFAKVRAEYPDSELAFPAESGRADLAKVMPGAPAPILDLVDDVGQKWSVASYKGRVLLLEIWSFNMPACLEAVPTRAALLKELESKPFNIVGINFDSLKPEEYHERARKAGITWRTALANYTDPVMASWEVRAYPTTILIDKKGIIRARNLPWAEMTDLARKLVQE
jgi:thiol-disulfide isomerase/thioredoxin